MKKNKKQMLALRILLGILIVCNMAVIFLLSSQTSAQSSALSKKITAAIVRILPEDYVEKLLNNNRNDGNKTETSTTQKPNTEKPKETTPEETKPQETKPEGTKPEETTPKETTPEETPPEETTPSKEQKPQNPKEPLTKEQEALARKSHTPIRKLAHMLEFGALATLAFLFLVTWRGNLLWRYAASLGFAFLYAATDEFHQQFSKGRGALFSDVIIDFYGALIACTVALIVVIVVRRIQTPKNERLSIAEELSLCFTRVSKIFSRCREFVSKQISKLSKIHHKKEREK